MHPGLLPEPLAHVTADELAFDEAVNALVDYIPCSSAPGRGWRFTGCCRLEAAESALEAAQTTAKEAEADFDAAQDRFDEAERALDDTRAARDRARRARYAASKEHERIAITVSRAPAAPARDHRAP